MKTKREIEPTPGPWVYLPRGPRQSPAAIITGPSGARRVQICALWDADGDRQQTDADGKLIAASPNMLKALQKVLIWLECAPLDVADATEYVKEAIAEALE